AACCLLPAACCLLPAACCLLPAACCLLPAAYRPPHALHPGSFATVSVRIPGLSPSSTCSLPHCGSPSPPVGARSTRIACSAAKVPVQPDMAPSIPSSAQVSQSSASNASPT